MTRTVVGILRGGTSGEYPLSLKSGAALLNALPEEQYDTRDIFIDKSGVWHSRGMPTDPPRALSQVDVVLNALHGGVGEDGTVQRILDQMGVPYAGSRAFQSGLSLHKARAREALQNAGVRMPQGIAFAVDDGTTTGDMARAVFAQFGPPYIVKPVSEGSSYGVTLARSIVDLPDVLGDVLDLFGAAVVEEYISGQETTVGLIEDFRGEELYALPPAEVLLHGAQFFPHEAHSDSSIRYNVPSSFSHEDKELIAKVARAAHKALELSHFSQVDLKLTKHGPYVLEINALPTLHEKSSFVASLESVGSSLKEFAEHAIGLARIGTIR